MGCGPASSASATSSMADHAEFVKTVLERGCVEAPFDRAVGMYGGAVPSDARWFRYWMRDRMVKIGALNEDDAQELVEPLSRCVNLDLAARVKGGLALLGFGVVVTNP